MWRSQTQLFIISFKGILVNSDSTSRLAIKREVSYFVISLTKLKESLTAYSLWVKGSKIDIKNFARLNPVLDPILEPLTHNEFTVKDFSSFAKETTKYYSSLFMESLDVESLFTNIPLKETKNNCLCDFQNKNLYNGNLN